MIEPKQVTFHNMNGVAKTYIISKMPYFAAREVISQFIPTATPKIGNYKDNEALAKIMFSFIQVVLPDGQALALTTQELIQNHVDLKTGLLLEKEMLEYNAAFLGGVNISSSLNTFQVKAQEWISKTLMEWQERSLQKAKPPLKNSKKRTR